MDMAWLSIEVGSSLTYKIIEKMLIILSPFILILLLMIVATIIYRYSKYGYKEFAVFKKQKETNYKRELLFLMIDKLKGYRKLLNLGYVNSDMIMIDETGIYLLKIINLYDEVNGDVEDDYLMSKIDCDQKTKITNPFKLLNEDEQVVYNKIQQKNIKKYLIVNNNCNINVSNTRNFNIIRLKDFYYEIERTIKSNKIYTKEEINQFYKKF